MITKASHPDDWSRLKQIWLEEGKPGYVIQGGTHYQVFTPDGEDLPQFLPFSEQTLYSTTSTGLASQSKTKRAKK